MIAPWILNAIGLLFSIVAAISMYYFPPRIILYTEKGEPVINWVANVTEEGKRLGRLQARISRMAPWVLAFGFFLQLIATLLAASSGKIHQ